MKFQEAISLHPAFAEYEHWPFANRFPRAGERALVVDAIENLEAGTDGRSCFRSITYMVVLTHMKACPIIRVFQISATDLWGPLEDSISIVGNEAARRWIERLEYTSAMLMSESFEHWDADDMPAKADVESLIGGK